MALADRPAARNRALVQDHVPERVLAAGYVSAAGSANASAFEGPTTGLIGHGVGGPLGRRAAAHAGFPPST